MHKIDVNNLIKEYPEFIEFVSFNLKMLPLYCQIINNYIDEALTAPLSYISIKPKDGISTTNFITLDSSIVCDLKWNDHIILSDQSTDTHDILMSYDMFYNIYNHIFNILKKIDIKGTIPKILYPPKPKQSDSKKLECISIISNIYARYTKNILDYFETPRFTHPNLDLLQMSRE